MNMKILANLDIVVVVEVVKKLQLGNQKQLVLNNFASFLFIGCIFLQYHCKQQYTQLCFDHCQISGTFALTNVHSRINLFAHG